jgi:hypothetical protein
LCRTTHNYVYKLYTYVKCFYCFDNCGPVPASAAACTSSESAPLGRQRGLEDQGPKSVLFLPRIGGPSLACSFNLKLSRAPGPGPLASLGHGVTQNPGPVRSAASDDSSDSAATDNTPEAQCQRGSRGSCNTELSHVTARPTAAEAACTSSVSEPESWPLFSRAAQCLAAPGSGWQCSEAAGPLSSKNDSEGPCGSRTRAV